LKGQIFKIFDGVRTFFGNRAENASLPERGWTPLQDSGDDMLICVISCGLYRVIKMLLSMC